MTPIRTTHSKNLVPRIVTIALWGAFVLSGSYWTKKLSTNTPNTATAQKNKPTQLQLPPDTAAISRLLSGEHITKAPTPIKDIDRFILSGLVANLNGQSAALISIDGAPAKPVLVGMQLAPGFILVAVARHEAILAETMASPIRTILKLSQNPLVSTLTVPSSGSTFSLPIASRDMLSEPNHIQTSPSLGMAARTMDPSSYPARMDARRLPDSITGMQR